MTMTDALGNRHHYDWDPDLGGYINPQTGGMLNPSLWNEYNRNLAANRAFSDGERRRLENRETDFDHRMDWLNTDRQRERRPTVSQIAPRSGSRARRASSDPLALAERGPAGPTGRAPCA